MGLKLRILAGASFVAVATLVALVPAASEPQADPPIARYTMDAGTLSGMAAMGRGGGGIGSIMAMMSGEGGQVAHELVLRLGSSRTPSGGAGDADHFMPEAAGLGRSVPLTHQRAPRGEQTMPMGEMPRGRLLLFWGCGEHVGPGQPVIIDFASMARGEMPPGLFAQGLNLSDDWSVRPDNSTTYGDWPNGDDARSVPGTASLQGHHRVASNYAPEIGFDLAQDFMPALDPVGTPLGSGATAMRWNMLDQATGYYAWAMGAGRRDNEMVWWTSASTQQFGGPFAEWISPGVARRYVEAGTLLPPERSECTIPAEVTQAASEGYMTSLYAYGPQVDFAYPPRPADARTPWRPEWIARVRFRSMAMMVPGMEMMGEASDRSGDTRETRRGEPAPAALPRCRGGLRGIAERAAGLCQ